MGNTSAKPHPRPRNKKVHWKAADRPTRPGKPQLVPDGDGTPDVLTIKWERPLKDGGSPITGYLVEHRRFGSPHWVRATPLLVRLLELTLSGLEPGWRYQFRVSAENAVGLSDPSELSEPLTVTLQRSAITTPRFTQELSDTVALENDKVEFVVYFLGQPSPKISWYKDGFEIFSSRRIRILTESDRSVLTIHQCQLVDSGEIKCTATNKAGHSSTKGILTLEAPPSIRLPRQYEEGLLFEIGEVIRLKISLAGLPAPLVFWSHNGESLQNGERYEIENYENSSTLKINEAKRSDRGEYQIKAVNKLGQDGTSFLVTVTDKPSAPGRARVVMTLGKSVTLSWNTPKDDGGCKIGNYIIEYYRLGWDVWLKAATSRQMTTVLGDLIEGSEYKFRIKAESPYGISDPSEESEVIFIPDAKRGITEPRSVSQPREIPNRQNEIPALPSRKKPRSQSSTRAESQRVQFQTPDEMPVRPERNKTRTPQRTPEPSPRLHRREINKENLSNTIFDRASMTRDLAYGTPDFKFKKTDASHLDNRFDQSELMESTKLQTFDIKTILPSHHNMPPSTITIQTPAIISQNRIFSLPTKSSISPNPQKSDRTGRYQVNRSRSPSPNELRQNGQKDRAQSPRRFLNARSPSPNVERKASKDFTGSSEFMLVLLPNENRSNEAHDLYDFNIDDILIPPPLSLSAPELGVEPPTFEGLKYSASSTELLHERAMMRLYETAQAEEAELRKNHNTDERRRNHVPKIQINDRNEDEVTLERKLSLIRRFSAGVNLPQHGVWAQKRHSLRNSGDLQELLEGRLHKFTLSPEDKRNIMMNRKRSESEEMEEEEFEKVRARMAHNKPKLLKKKSIDVVDLEKWDGYEESDKESSTDDRIYDQVPNIRRVDEEDTTYNPFMRSIQNKKDHEPFEILTKPNKLPDPNFKPKPILKRSNDESEINSHVLSPSTSRSASKSPPIEENPNSLGGITQNKRGILPWASNTKETLYHNIGLQSEGRRDSSPIIDSHPFETVSAIASISGFAAAGVVIPEPLLSKKKYHEEAKVVIDHYADIVKSHSQKGKSNSLRRSDDNAQNLHELSQPDLTERVITSKEELGSTIERVSERKANPPILFTDSSNENLRRHDNTRSRHDSSSSSQRSSSPTKSRMRKGSPTVRNKEISSFRTARQQEISQNATKRTRTPSKSPGKRGINSSPQRRMRHLSVSSVETTSLSTQTSIERRSPSPIRLRPPKMKEIMTQTSTCVDSIISSTAAKLSIVLQKPSDDQLQKHTEKKVRSTIDYITDLAMFTVACWLYLFNNELLAVPVLLLMVYRQVKDEISRRIPKWMLPKSRK